MIPVGNKFSIKKQPSEVLLKISQSSQKTPVPVLLSRTSFLRNTSGWLFLNIELSSQLAMEEQRNSITLIVVRTQLMTSSHHCVKSVYIRNYSGWYFPAFWLITERYEVSPGIQSESVKIRTRIRAVLPSRIFCYQFYFPMVLWTRKLFHKLYLKNGLSILEH